MHLNIINLLERLEYMEPLEPDQSRSWLELKIIRTTKALRWISGTLFVFLLFFAAIALLWPDARTHHDLTLTARITSILATFCGIALMLLDMIPGIISLAFHKKYLARVQLLRAKQDFDHITALMEIDFHTLQLAQQWLAIEIERMSSRIAFMFGAADKVAIVSLIGLGWSVWKESSALGTSWVGTATQCTFALFGGFAIGSLFIRDRIQQLTYKKNLLGVAISQAKISGAKKHSD